jgi:hypothetical protein
LVLKGLETIESEVVDFLEVVVLLIGVILEDLVD